MRDLFDQANQQAPCIVFIDELDALGKSQTAHSPIAGNDAEDDRFLMIEDEIRGRLAKLLGGRAAEELIFHKISTGVSDDIQKATDLAERCVTLYGMSKALGPVAIEHS